MWCPVERRIRRVQRWLDRCLEACRIGQWQAALAEMECARTDLEIARRALWEQVTAEGAVKPKPHRGVAMLRGALVSALVILSAAHPLAFDDPSTVASRSSAPEIMAFVTQDEQTLLLALRARLGEGALRQTEAEFEQLPAAEKAGRRSGETVLGVGGAAPAAAKRSSGTAGARSVTRQGVGASPPETTGVPLAAEDLLALVQVGERALRDAAVRVVGD